MRMTPRILTACAIAALTVGTQAHAQELPSWNPQTICTEDATPQYCRFLEGQARAQISQQWVFIPTLIRERCLTASDDDESTRSWRLFGDCLADAARPPRADAMQTVAGGGAAEGGSGAGSEEVDALRAELATARERLQELEAAGEAAGGENEGSQARIADITAQLETAESERIRGEDRITGLQGRLMSAMAASRAASGEFGAERETMQAALDAATAAASEAELRADALQARLTEALESAETSTGAETEAMAARVTELEAAIEKADTETRRGTARIEGLQARLMALGDAAATDAEVPDADAERIAELEASLEAAETQNKRSTARIAGLQERLVAAMDSAAAQSEPGDTTEADARIAALETDLEKARSLLRTGEVRIEGLQQRLLESAEASETAGTATAEVDDLTRRLETAESRIESLQSRLRTSRENALERARQSGLAASDLNDARAQVAALQDAMSQARSDSGSADAATAEVADLTRRLETADSRIENLQSRLGNSRENVAEIARRSALDAANLANARARIAALQDAMIEARRDSEATAAAQAAEQQDVAAVEERFGRLMDNQRERAARVAATVSGQRSRIAELEDELGTLRRMATQVAEQAENDDGALECQQRMAGAVEAGGIQFANNKAEIRADAARTIDRLIVIARDCPDARITVRGHTDSMGERDYNLYLSELRAAAVVEYMSRNGLAPDRIDAVGVGPDEPVANNNTRAGRASNRRIEIRVQ